MPVTHCTYNAQFTEKLLSCHRMKGFFMFVCYASVPTHLLSIRLGLDFSSGLPDCVRDNEHFGTSRYCSIY